MELWYTFVFELFLFEHSFILKKKSVCVCFPKKKKEVDYIK